MLSAKPLNGLGNIGSTPPTAHTHVLTFCFWADFRRDWDNCTRFAVRTQSGELTQLLAKAVGAAKNSLVALVDVTGQGAHHTTGPCTCKDIWLRMGPLCAWLLCGVAHCIEMGWHTY